MATWAEALLVQCPECDAPKGQQCTYLPLANRENYGPEGKWAKYSQGVQRQLVRVGQPTDRPHNGRFNKAHNKFYRPRYRRLSRPVQPPSDRQLAIARAENQFDRVEQNKVFWWLQAYGSILQVKEEETDADRS